LRQPRSAPEKAFYVDPRNPASSSGLLRRVDLVVRYFEAKTYIPQVLIFHEAKKHAASRTHMRDIEEQAHEACATYYGTTRLTHVYARTLWEPLLDSRTLKRTPVWHLYSALNRSWIVIPISMWTHRKLVVLERAYFR